MLGVLAARNAYELDGLLPGTLQTPTRSEKRIETLFSEIKDIEVAQREYILTGGEQPLKTITETIARNPTGYHGTPDTAEPTRDG